MPSTYACPTTCTPPAAIAAAEAGEIVLCEKPLSLSLDEAIAMNGAGCQVPTITFTRQLVDAGRLGTVFHYNASYKHPGVSELLSTGADHRLRAPVHCGARRVPGLSVARGATSPRLRPTPSRCSAAHPASHSERRPNMISGYNNRREKRERAQRPPPRRRRYGEVTPELKAKAEVSHAPGAGIMGPREGACRGPAAEAPRNKTEADLEEDRDGYRGRRLRRKHGYAFIVDGRRPPNAHPSAFATFEDGYRANCIVEAILESAKQGGVWTKVGY